MWQVRRGSSQVDWDRSRRIFCARDRNRFDGNDIFENLINNCFRKEIIRRRGFYTSEILYRRLFYYHNCSYNQCNFAKCEEELLAASGSVRFHCKYVRIQSHSTCVMTSSSGFSGSPLFLVTFHCAIRSRLFTPSCRATGQRRRQKANHRRILFFSN